MTALTTAPTTTGARLAQRLRTGIDWRRDIVYIGFVVVFVAFAILLRDQGFLSSGNLLNILRQAAIVGVMAVGMTFVIACAEIDLSVGSVAGLASITTAMVIARFGLWPGIVAGIAVGIVVGAINGSLVAFARIPSFLVTLAMLGIAVGLAQWVTHSAPQPILDSTYTSMFGSGSVGFLPGLVVWTAVAVVVGAVVLKKARFGRQVLATGANRTAAEYSGINTRAIRFRVMMISATAAALAGMLYAGRLQSGRFQFGAGDELNAIAAVILGGTALSGGRGSVVGSLMGALLMQLISNGLILAGLDPSQQQVVAGVIIVLAVALARNK